MLSPIPVLEIKGLRRRFYDHWALDGVDLRVDGPGVFGFLGVNGAGKTTTLKILAGLIHPTAGEARIFGSLAGAQDPQVRRRLGYLPQDPAFYDFMSGLETLLFAADLLGMDARTAKSKSLALLDRLGLGDAAKRRVSGYSGGMRQRLGIAQALMGDPELLLLDEPVSALDPVGRAEMLELLQELGTHCTVFMSSHILADIERVCPELAILDQGKIVVRERTAQLRGRYLLPAFDLQLAAPAPELTAKAAQTSWVDRVEQLETTDVLTMRLYVKEIAVAQREIAALLASSAVQLISIAPVVPTLEQIFMQLVHHETLGESA